MFLGAGLGAYGVRDVPPLHARVLQGAALPRRRASSSTASPASRTSGRWAACASAMPFTHAIVPVGTLALVGIPPLAGFWSKDAILASALADGGALGWTLYVGGLVGALLTGALRVPALLHRLPRRAVRRYVPRARTHEHAHARRRPALDADPGRRARRRSRRSRGLLQIPGVWEPFDDWLEPVAEPLVEPVDGAGLADEPDRGDARRHRHRRRLAGLHARVASSSADGAVADGRSSTSSTSTSSTTRSSPRPAQALAVAAARRRRDARRPGRRSTRSPTGRCDARGAHVARCRAASLRTTPSRSRSRSPSSPSSSWWCADARRRCSSCARSPARCSSGCCRSRARRRRARAPRRARRGRPLDRRRRATSTSPAGAAAVLGDQRVVRRPRHLATTSASTASSSGSPA